jgi:tetratricopeptide (TPR) repeat protein
MREAQAEAYTALADVLGNTSNQNLGDSRGAVELYKKSLGMREKLASEAPTDTGRQESLAISSSRLSQQLQALDDKPGAVAAARRAAEIFDAMLRKDPGNADVRRSAAVASRNLAMSLMKMSAAGEARVWGDRSMAILEQVAADDPGNLQASVDMADGYYVQGMVRAGGNDYEAARAFYDRAIAIQTKLAAEHPGEAPRPGLRTAYQLLADLNIKMGDARQAITNAEHQLAIDAWFLKADPKNAGAVRNKGVAFRQIGQAHELNGMELKGSRDRRVAELAEAKRWYRLSLDVFEAQKAAGTLVPAYAGELEKTPAAIGRCDLALGKLGR